MLIRQFLRRTPIYRSSIVVSSYRRNHQIETNASTTSTQHSAQSTKEKLSANPNDWNKLLEYLKADANDLKRVKYKLFHNVVNLAVKDYVSPSEGVFLLGCSSMLPDTSKQEKSKLIDTIWNDGIVRCGQPTKEQIVALLRAYKVIGRTIDDFNAFLAQYDCVGDIELYEEFLYLACENGEITDGIVKVLTDIKDRGFPLTENLFNALILGHSKNKNVDNCEKVVHTMVLANVKPTSETYMQLVRAYIENGDATKATILLGEHGHTFSQDQIFLIIKTAAVNDAVDLIKEAMQLLPQNSLLNKDIVPGLRNICTEVRFLSKLTLPKSYTKCHKYLLK